MGGREGGGFCSPSPPLSLVFHYSKEALAKAERQVQDLQRATNNICIAPSRGSPDNADKSEMAS